ncbi:MULTISPECIES: Uma2 family endonuclease [Salinibacter]|uniref:Uma2 family endonuclease n=1 Tax=Salinibacter TaxID=146918 RepID=UPI0021E8D87F|nr:MULTISPECIES: Uma2 family endonuclease [Salinibacter]
MTELASPAATEVRPRRFTSDEVQVMLRAGILHEDDPLELIDGQLVVMSPINDPHIACINRLNTIFSKRLVPHAIENVVVSVQNPVRIDEHNEPEPDVVLSTALDGAPHPGDVLLLVEVSDTTLAYDRDVKRPLYARAGIPEVWVLDLEARHIEVHREPDDDVYRTRHLAGLDDTVTPERPTSVGDIPVRDILGDLPEPESDEREA